MLINGFPSVALQGLFYDLFSLSLIDKIDTDEVGEFCRSLMVSLVNTSYSPSLFLFIYFNIINCIVLYCIVLFYFRILLLFFHLFWRTYYLLWVSYQLSYNTLKISLLSLFLSLDAEVMCSDDKSLRKAFRSLVLSLVVRTY